MAAIEAGVPQLVEAREMIAAFQAMIRKRSLADLEPWLAQARLSLAASFAARGDQRSGGGCGSHQPALVERPD